MRKIWNRPNLPVWSLSTMDASGVGNMNICTYVSSISMEPKLIMIALYQGTKTYANVLESKRAVLQLLSEPLAPVIRVCGHESGHVTHKITRLQKKYDLETIHGLSYFIEAAGYMELLLDKLVSVDGDHDLGIFSVVIHKNLNDVPLLTTDYLRSKGLLR